MSARRFALPSLALLVFSCAASSHSALAEPLPLQEYGQDSDWDRPPQGYEPVQQLAFHDGVRGARADFDNHRRPDPMNRDEYRHPHVEYQLRSAYQDAFRRGYQMAASHLWNGRGNGRRDDREDDSGSVAPPQGPPPMQGEWGMRGMRSEAQRQGFREGMNDARRDVAQGRRIDPDDSREYRNPPVPPEIADEYREGFMRGYEVALSQVNGGSPWQTGGDPNSWMPERFTEMQRRGFHDGVEGANKDFGNHRNPNPANRDEYRSPELPQELWHEYREGFRRGYEMAANRLWGGQ